MYSTVRTSCVLAALTVNYSSYARAAAKFRHTWARVYLLWGGVPMGKYSAYNANGGVENFDLRGGVDNWAHPTLFTYVEVRGKTTLTLSCLL